MLNAISAWFSELAPRERRLVGLFGVLFVLGLLFLVPYFVDASLRDSHAANAELKDAVMRVSAGRAAVKNRQAKRDAITAKYAKRAPKLGGYLEQIGKDEEIDLPEMQDKPEVPIGKKYVERATQLRLRKVGGYPFLKFLEKIEQSGYPLSISRLNVRKRSGEHDLYDIELGVSAYDRVDAGAPPSVNDGKGGSSGAGGSSHGAGGSK